MIILNKKRIILVVLSVFLSLLIFMLTSEIASKKQDYITTVSLPVSGKVIVVDAGHRFS